MTSTRRSTEAGPAARARLLVVDDGTFVNRPLMRALAEGGFKFESVADPDYALEETRGQRYDAIVINSDCSKVDALRLCLALRVQGCLSVIVIVSRASTATDQLDAFRVGATDRIRCAMPRRLLVERILAQIAGCRVKVTGLLHPLTAELPTPAGRFTLSLVPALIKVNDRPLSFTRIEERLISRLWTAQGAVVSNEELRASGWLGASVSTRTVTVHISHLRRKLRRFGLHLEHQHGRGYRLSLQLPENLRRNSMADWPKN